MGRYYKIICSSCGKELEFFTGIGFFGPSEEDAYNQIQNEPEFKNIQRIVSSPAEISDVKTKFFYCKKCNYLYAKLAFKIISLNKQVKRICPECKSYMKCIDKNFEKVLQKEIKINCPDCNAKDILLEDLSNFSIGCWD